MRRIVKSIIGSGIFILELPMYAIDAIAVTLYWARDKKDRSWIAIWRMARGC